MELIDRNLIIQFPVFIEPYTQQPLKLYQIETVPVNNNNEFYIASYPGDTISKMLYMSMEVLGDKRGNIK